MTDIGQTINDILRARAKVREAGFSAGGMESPRRRSRILTAAIGAGFVGLLALGACGGDDNQDVTPAGAAGSGAGVSGTATSSAAASSTGGSSATASSVGGARATTPSAGKSGGAGKASAGKAGGAGKASAGKAGAAGKAGTTSNGGKPSVARPLSTGLSFETITETPGVAPYFNINRPKDLDAAIAKTGGPLPVITWGNGACMRSDAMWKTFYDRWASAGWFVLSLNTVPAGASGSSSITADDQQALNDWLFAEVEKKDSPYAGKLDTKRVVAAGNSCGGVTALTVGSRDERVTALFILAGSSGLGSSNATIMNGIKVPVCWIEGGEEELSRGPATSDYENLADDVPALMVVRSSGDHLLISNDLTSHAQSAEISLNWLDLALYGTPEAHKVLTSKGPLCSGCEASLWTVLMSQNLDKLVKK
jgi:hypothetical protein